MYILITIDEDFIISGVNISNSIFKPTKTVRKGIDIVDRMNVKHICIMDVDKATFIRNKAKAEIKRNVAQNITTIKPDKYKDSVTFISSAGIITISIKPKRHFKPKFCFVIIIHIVINIRNE